MAGLTLSVLAEFTHGTTSLDSSDTEILNSFYILNFTQGVSGSDNLLPKECLFEWGRGYSFAYAQLHLGNNKIACVGFNNQISCDQSAWSDGDYADMIDAVKKLVAKDGMFKTAKTRSWLAYFFEMTSAFGDMGAWVLFHYVIDTLRFRREKQWKDFYFSYDGDFLYCRK